ncbi:hypothetical protein FQA47_021255 [Oryzias melastigma]|uniref:Uncharacterized protein n=1 Tax=Oryzias melastigma TaxID=30732 RepID=A0A834F1C5_ORYME|nr:hypothetical protein FQA47_021255 [Oryzias melastigma]
MTEVISLESASSCSLNECVFRNHTCCGLLPSCCRSCVVTSAWWGSLSVAVGRRASAGVRAALSLRRQQSVFTRRGQIISGQTLITFYTQVFSEAARSSPEAQRAKKQENLKDPRQSIYNQTLEKVC